MRPLALASVTLPIAGTVVLVVLGFAHRGVYRWLVVEDSVFEWAQVIAYVVAAVAAGAVAAAFWRAGDRLRGTLFAGLALACLLAAGEEVSWGQRLLGIETPEGLAARNAQGETNAHNLEGAKPAVDAVVLAASAYGTFAPLVRRLRDLLLAPPLFLAPAFGLLLVYEAARLLFFDDPSYALAKWSEWPELCFAMALAVFALLARQRARASQ